MTTPDGVPEHARGYENFRGRIGRTLRDSTPSWTAPRQAAPGAPNVVVVLADDLGFSDIEPYGSEIPTPNLAALASRGVLMTNYHTAPLCSPARAALLTGLNPHRAGFGTVADRDAGFPGLRLELADDVATLAETFRAAGYATFAVGKWHLTREASLHDGADKSSWPVQRGFDRYYGSMEGCNSFFHPNRPVADNSPVRPPEPPDGYYLTDDLTEQALRMVKALKAGRPGKPFFLYFAHVAMHGPLGAKAADLRAFQGRYDEGWDVLRRRRFERQVAGGLLPPGTTLPPRHHEPGFDVEEWATLPAGTRDRYARYMEVYAAMVGTLDQSLGALRGVLGDLGELDNTIFVFTSDNGGTKEGGATGTRSYFSRFAQIAGLPRDWELDVERDPSLIGGPRTMVHYPRGWGQVSNTPFRYFKGQTHAGGVRVPCIVSWERGRREGRLVPGVRSAFQYVTDLFPTLLELTGVERLEVRNGRPAKPIDGISFAGVLASPSAPGTRFEQYAETGGHRGFYRDGWKIVSSHERGHPLDDSEWELYRVDTDPTEMVDLASAEPGVLAELAAAWERAAWANTVFPVLDPGPDDDVRSPDGVELDRPVRLLRGTPKLERFRSSRLISLRSFVVDIEMSFTPGDRGVLLCHGDQGGGYVVFVEDGRVRLSYNEYGRMHRTAGEPLSASSERVELTAVARPGVAWDLTLTVGGAAAGSLDNVAMLVGMAPFSGIEVGVNSGGPVDWQLFERHGSFAYTGSIGSVTYRPGELSAYDERAVRGALLDSYLTFE